MEPLTEVRDRLQEEFDDLPYPVQWGTFTLGRIATLEATNAALLEALEYIVEQYPNNRGMNKAREAIRKRRGSDNNE